MLKTDLEKIITEGPQVVNEFEEGAIFLTAIALKSILIGLGVIFGMKAGFAHAKHKEIKGREKRECANLEGQAKKVCGLKVRLDFHKQVMQNLTHAKKQCSRTSNPDRCNLWIDKQIIKVKKSLTIAEYKLKQAQQG